MYSLFSTEHLDTLNRLCELYFSLGMVLKENEKHYRCFLSSTVVTDVGESYYTAHSFFQYEPVLDKYSAILVPVHNKDGKRLVLWGYGKNTNFGEVLVDFLKKYFEEEKRYSDCIVWKVSQISACVSD